ncbi:STAS domain-containing protein [Acidimicrobiia bacterium EGI L10123]|uniref:STAS domain-containing protein n=1 Tax=Salinilacustrithrix flava TaxID=2957203 RepID=UPI003D7C171B|nr:STAS domain-containing protein [Acidimicrobiia bacterium EGI L10123]
MEITTDRRDDYVVCRPHGELDAYTADELCDSVAAITNPDIVVIDLSEVSFMDSTGLGRLIGAVRRTGDAGGDVAVCSPSPFLHRLLETVGFDRIVPVTDTVDGAVEDIRSRR